MRKDLGRRDKAFAPAYRRLALCLAAPIALALLFSGCAPDDASEEEREIVFTTLGSSFSPLVAVAEGATLRWTWADGSTSVEARPAKDYGSPAPRENRLLVTPWNALTEIDIGYDGGDGGSLDYGEYYVPDQHVASVENLDLVSGSLRIWCSSYNNIQSLDFSGFAALETIECYLSQSLYSVGLEGTSALRRACFEDCDLEVLDLGGCPALEDLRGAVNDYRTIGFGDFEYPGVWHVCVRDNYASIADRAIFASTARFPALRELFIWNDNQAGELVVPSTGSGDVSIQAANNYYARADFSGALQDETSYGEINLSNNRLASIALSGCDQVVALNLENNALPQAEVDYVLAILIEGGRPNGVVNLGNPNGGTNATPSETGLASAATLRTRGWTVTLASP